MSNKIVVPYDFTSDANVAVEYSAELAKKFECELVLLHIIAELPMAQNVKEVLHTHPVYKAIPKNLEEVVERVKESHDINATYEVEEGSLFEHIASYSESLNALFIVLATHGIKGVQHLSGSYAGKVINSTKIPVLVTQKDTQFSPFRNVLVPIHQQDNLQHLSNWTAKIASKFGSVVHFAVAAESIEDSKFSLEQFQAELENLKVSHMRYDEDDASNSFEQFISDTYVHVNADFIITEQHKDEGKHEIGSEAQTLITNQESIPVLVLDPRAATIEA